MGARQKPHFDSRSRSIGAPQPEQRTVLSSTRARASSPGVRAAHELLLAQELGERREAPVVVRTAIVGEAAGLPHVAGEDERALALRALRPLGERPAHVVAVPVDVLEELDHRARRELKALVPIEPDRVARVAESTCSSPPVVRASARGSIG